MRAYFLPDPQFSKVFLTQTAGLMLAAYFCAAEGFCQPAVTVPEHLELLKDIRYQEGNGPAWTLDLAQPRQRSAKPRPVVIVIHGGGWVEGDKSSFSSYEQRVPGNIIDLADLGFVAVTINYRLSREAAYPAAIQDCRSAVRWLKAHATDYYLDPNRIAAYGNSAGGHLALLLGMTDNSDRVHAIISDSGPIDMIAQHQQGTLRGVVEMFLTGPPDASLITDYQQASPSRYVNGPVPPVLLIYGVADEQIPITSADDFVRALHAAGNSDVTYHRLAATGHCPHSIQRVTWLQPAVNEFLVRVLKPETTGGH